jgi:hypothetical protein
LGFAAHGHAQDKKGGQKISTGQDEILSEKNTPATCGGGLAVQADGASRHVVAVKGSWYPSFEPEKQF